jgi:hypothetical protein
MNHASQAQRGSYHLLRPHVEEGVCWEPQTLLAPSVATAAGAIGFCLLDALVQERILLAHCREE